MFVGVHILLSNGKQRLPSTKQCNDLVELARACSPHFTIFNQTTVVLDANGLRGLWGDFRAVGSTVRRMAIQRGIHCRVALATTRTASVLLAYGGSKALTVTNPGHEKEALALLPLTVLESVFSETNTSELTEPSFYSSRKREVFQHAGSEAFRAFRRWGLSTLGDLTALPCDELFARLGVDGEAWQRCARGEDVWPLMSVPDDLQFEEIYDFEWPIEEFEPLAFVIGQVLERLMKKLAQCNVAAAALTVQCWLVTRVYHTRTLQLPTPIRDPQVLQTLLLLDLETHPPSAGIDRIIVSVTPGPARVVQFSLLRRAFPSPEQLSTLLARLTTLMGKGKCGAPILVDSHRPGAFDMQTFNPNNARIQSSVVMKLPLVGLRRFRCPVAARVMTDCGRPVQISAGDGIGNRSIVGCAGPWRSSGHWWMSRESASKHQSVDGFWSYDEWDVALSSGGVYRIYRDRALKAWFVSGMMD